MNTDCFHENSSIDSRNMLELEFKFGILNFFTSRGEFLTIKKYDKNILNIMIFLSSILFIYVCEL
jgi:hypothetical protein